MAQTEQSSSAIEPPRQVCALADPGMVAIVLLLAALGIYWLSATLAGHTNRRNRPILTPADSFLNGQLYLQTQLPPAI
jgi:hypothetical protein